MSRNLTSEYPDAFNLSIEKIREQKDFSPKYMKRCKKQKKLLKQLKELKAQYLAKLEEIAEEKRRVEEARIAEEEHKKKKKPSFFAKLGDAIIKAVPKALIEFLKFCAKNFFSRKSERKNSKL